MKLAESHERAFKKSATKQTHAHKSIGSVWLKHVFGCLFVLVVDISCLPEVHVQHNLCQGYVKRKLKHF